VHVSCGRKKVSIVEPKAGLSLMLMEEEDASEMMKVSVKGDGIS
jgi:hypothetical protein